MERILVAFTGPEAQKRILRLLEGGGYVPAACGPTGAEVIREAHQLEAAVVVCGFKLRDMTAEELAHVLWNEAALLVISSAANLDFCQGENLFKLASPFSRSDFFASLELPRRYLSNRPATAAPRRREEEQKLVARAKALLMEINRMTEAEAHRYLQKRSMDTGAKLWETAQWIIDSHS